MKDHVTEGLALAAAARAIADMRAVIEGLKRVTLRSFSSTGASRPPTPC